MVECLCSVRWCPRLNTTLGLLHPVHIITSYVMRLQFNIISPYMLRSCKEAYLLMSFDIFCKMFSNFSFVFRQGIRNSSKIQEPPPNARCRKATRSKCHPRTHNPRVLSARAYEMMHVSVYKKELQ
jgi:hypothetical protein